MNLRAFLQLPPAPAAPEISAIEQRTENGYTRSLLKYRAPDGDEIEAFVFRPRDAAPRASILALHQHNSQWTLGKSEIAGLSGDPLQAFGPALARHGLAVLAPDAAGFESRQSRASSSEAVAPPPLTRPHSTPDGWLQYYNQMAHRLVQGDLLMRKALTDCELAVSILQTFFPASPIGALGHSYGGILTLFLTAVDPRVAFACSSGAACSYKYKLAHGIPLDMSLIIPGIVTHFDLPDVIRSISPRRLFLVSAADDPSSADANDLVQAANCPACLEHLRVPGAHALDQRRFDAIVNWTLAQSVVR